MATITKVIDTYLADTPDECIEFRCPDGKRWLRHRNKDFYCQNQQHAYLLVCCLPFGFHPHPSLIVQPEECGIVLSDRFTKEEAIVDLDAASIKTGLDYLRSSYLKYSARVQDKRPSKTKPVLKKRSH